VHGPFRDRRRDDVPPCWASGFLLDASRDALDCVEKILESDGDSIATGRDDGCLIHQIGNVCTGEPGRERRDPIAIHRRELYLARMHIENLPATLLIGAIDHHLAVETTGPQQSRIEDFRTIGRGKQNDPDPRVESVAFGEQLIERLFLLVDTTECSLPIASSSSMKMMQGAALRACSNRSRTRALCHE